MIPEPNFPKKEGYGFARWFTDINRKNPYDFNVPIMNDTTIYAAWYPEFDDVKDPVPWFYEVIYEGAHLGLMTGYQGTNLFGPYDKMDRQTVAVALYKVAGKPAVSQKEIDRELAKFTDGNEVADWARAGIAWCSINKKFTGLDNGDGTYTAAPRNIANREMVATFLWRFAGSPASVNPDRFNLMPDKGTVSYFAVTAMQWCMEKSIITGVEIESDDPTKDFIIAPFWETDRAQMMAMLVRLHRISK